MFRVLLNDADGSIEWNEGFSARMTCRKDQLS
jgi:hypothetical protein